MGSFRNIQKKEFLTRYKSDFERFKLGLDNSKQYWILIERRNVNWRVQRTYTLKPFTSDRSGSGNRPVSYWSFTLYRNVR